jgi:hypothetical protein
MFTIILVSPIPAIQTEASLIREAAFNGPPLAYACRLRVGCSTGVAHFTGTSRRLDSSGSRVDCGNYEHLGSKGLDGVSK